MDVHLHCRISHLPIVLLPTILLFFLSDARDTITPTTPLVGNDTLVSGGGGRFSLGFFKPDINSTNTYIGIWYRNMSVWTSVWVANRQNPVADMYMSNVLLSITKEEGLMLTDQNSSRVVWRTVPPTGLISPVARLLDSGNFVVMEGLEEYYGTKIAWQSFDYPTDTLLPGMKLGVDRTTGLIRNLTAWRSPTDPSPGNYILALDIKAGPQLSLQFKKQKKWRSEPWNGNYAGDLFVNSDHEATYSNSSNSQSSVFSRLWVDSAGSLQSLKWEETARQWSATWSAISQACDQYDTCGPNSECYPAPGGPDSDHHVNCSCLEGFIPKHEHLPNQGCVRRTKLDCRNGTDGFMALEGVKLPDTAENTVSVASEFGDCMATCLNNCSCTAFADNYAGGTCLLWMGDLLDLTPQDWDIYSEGNSLYMRSLYIRLAASDLELYTREPSEHDKKLKLVLGGTSLLFVLFLVLCCIGCLLWRRKKKNEKLKTVLDIWSSFLLLVLSCFGCLLRRIKMITNNAKEPINEKTSEEDSLDLPCYDFSTIAAATNHFCDENKLGEGGFGPVYKGKLRDNQEIAVKRLAKTSQQGTIEFKNEVILIAKLQHRNLVRLLGCCTHGDERMLIYEYMVNKSLDAFLFEKEKAILIDWNTRYQIIWGITRGLLYLHHDSRVRIIHRDLKASNILLDEDMNPKISDFGMARIFIGDDSNFNTRKVVGTYGYMSPEYALDGNFSMKSDVFSFGVLVLEVISGKKNRGLYAHSLHLNLVAHAWSLWNEGKISELIDKSIQHSVVMDEVLKCIKIGLLCVQEHAEGRPLMSNVIQMLGCDISSLPQPKQPGFIGRMDIVDVDPSPAKSTTNKITVSLLDGR